MYVIAAGPQGYKKIMIKSAEHEAYHQYLRVWKQEKPSIFQHLSFDQRFKFHAQLSWAWKQFYILGANLEFLALVIAFLHL